jgi:ankyrin repeat protein
MSWFNKRSPDEELLEAARNCDVGGVRAALAHGANPNAREPTEGQSPLHLCLRGRMGSPQPVAAGVVVRAFRSIEDTEMIADVLLGGKADPNAQDNDGVTPLHWAAGYNLSNAAQSLLRSGANPNVADKMGITPLHQAAGSAAVTVARLLIEAGAQINRRTAEGATPFAYCKNQRVFPGPDPFEPMRSAVAGARRNRIIKGTVCRGAHNTSYRRENLGRPYTLCRRQSWACS